MSKLFICAHSAKLESKAVIDALTKEGMINDWFYSMKGSFFFRSEFGAKELSDKMQAIFGGVRYIMIDIESSSKWGSLPSSHWDKILKRK